MNASGHIALIGAGALGIRHLEGLLKTSTPLRISVIDSSQEALKKAQALTSSIHTISCHLKIPKGDVDVAIIATTSDPRAAVVRDLLSRASVRFMILEKILFTRADDYESIDVILKEKGVKGWVNTPLRVMPMRRELRDMIGGKKFFMHIAGGSQHGLMTNMMHYADYACFLARSWDFTVDTSLLSRDVLDSKRAGYKELLGSIELNFKNGSRTLCTSLRHARARRTIISCGSVRAVFDEADEIVYVAEKQNEWSWKDQPAPFMYQSAMTGPLIETILSTGECNLPTYEESANMHVSILKPIQLFLRGHGHAFETDFPFT